MHHLTSDQNSNTNSVSNSNANPPAPGPLAVRPPALKTRADRIAGQAMAAIELVATVIGFGFACA